MFMEIHTNIHNLERAYQNKPGLQKVDWTSFWYNMMIMIMGKMMEERVRPEDESQKLS